MEISRLSFAKKLNINRYKKLDSRYSDGNQGKSNYAEEQQMRRIINEIGKEKGRWITDKHGNLIRTDEPRKMVEDRKDADDVAIGEYSIEEFGSGFKYLKTEGLASCVGLTLYDPVKRIGLLAHINPPQKDINASMEKMVNDLIEEGADVSRLQAKVISGTSSLSYDLLYDIYKVLDKRPIPIVEKDIFLGSVYNNPNGCCIMFDLETGSADSYRPKYNCPSWGQRSLAYTPELVMVRKHEAFKNRPSS